MNVYREMDHLVELAKAARERPAWRDFARFCDLRGRGLRADSLKSLRDFLEEANSWLFDARLEFTRWLLERWPWSANLPQPMHEQLIVPTVQEWRRIDVQQPLTYLWLGLLGCDNPTVHLEHAFDLDPRLDLARRTLVEWGLADINYNQHHLPELYINDPRIDLLRLVRIDQIISADEAPNWAVQARREIPELQRNAQDWLNAHPREGDFASH